MSIFDFFRTNHKESSHPIGGATSEMSQSDDTNVSDKTDNSGKEEMPPEIPEHIFVEYDKPKKPDSMETNESPQQVQDLQTLYSYLEQNLEKKGYEDALMNPDSSCRDEHIRFIQNELSLMISRVKTYYNGYTRTINLHIETRKRGGMLELVDELITTRDTVEDELKIVNQIEQDSKNANGLTENLFLSYKKGFKNGFAAITYNTVLKRS